MALTGIASGQSISGMGSISSSPEQNSVEGVALAALIKRVSEQDKDSESPLKQRVINPVGTPENDPSTPRTPDTVERVRNEPDDPVSQLNRARSTPCQLIPAALLDIALEQGMLTPDEFAHYNSLRAIASSDLTQQDRTFIRKKNNVILTSIQVDGIGGPALQPRGLFHEVGASTLSSSGLWDN